MLHTARVSILLSGLLWVGAASTAWSQLPSDLALDSLVEGGDAVTLPLALRHAGDGSGRLFVAEKAGVVRIHDPGRGWLSQPFLDISADVSTTVEGALSGLAFHPDYAVNGLFYVYYVRDGDPLTTVVRRFSVSGDPDLADPASGLDIVSFEQPDFNHNGGDIHFGPDGLLLIGLGDGGPSSTSARANAQDPGVFLGKMLRIDPCATPSCTGGPYSVPGDNPFVGPGDPLDEIWASGLRNPYRWSFDRQTGDLFVADVGNLVREEVSFQPRGVGGLNYGWDCREGDLDFPSPSQACGDGGGFVEPIIALSSDPADSPYCSITGGYRYRGCIEGLRDRYVFGDWCTGQVFFAVETTPGSWSIEAPEEWDLEGRIYGFGEDEAGELYVLTGDDVLRFDSATACTVLHVDGFELGDTRRWQGG